MSLVACRSSVMVVFYGPLRILAGHTLLILIVAMLLLSRNQEGIQRSCSLWLPQRPQSTLRIQSPLHFHREDLYIFDIFHGPNDCGSTIISWHAVAEGLGRVHTICLTRDNLIRLNSRSPGMGRCRTMLTGQTSALRCADFFFSRPSLAINRGLPSS